MHSLSHFISQTKHNILRWRASGVHHLDKEIKILKWRSKTLRERPVLLIALGNKSSFKLFTIDISLSFTKILSTGVRERKCFGCQRKCIILNSSIPLSKSNTTKTRCMILRTLQAHWVLWLSLLSRLRLLLSTLLWITTFLEVGFLIEFFVIALALPICWALWQLCGLASEARHRLTQTEVERLSLFWYRHYQSWR